MTQQQRNRWLHPILLAVLALVLLVPAPTTMLAATKEPFIHPTPDLMGDATSQYLILTCLNANMRDQPGGQTIHRVLFGSLVDFHYRDGAWSKVSHDGYTGWILNTALC